MKRPALIAILLLSFFALSLHPSTARATEAKDPKTVQQDAKEDKPVGGESGQKGGIYVVGRGFKTAGHGMEQGFKAAGRGIVKGGKATGRAFKKAGGSIKNFFTGETGDNKK